MSVRTLKILVVIGVCLASCAEAQDDGKPKTGFIKKTFADEKGTQIPYVVYVPRDYDGTKAYPVIVYLHGGGEKKPIPWGLGTFIQARGDLDFLCVFPHSERPWDPGRPGEKNAIGALDAVLAHYNADRNRVYLTGFSMGGTGTWSLGAKYADRWAALVPVASESTPEWAAKTKDIPAWAFEGSEDLERGVQKGREAVDFVKKVGGHPKYTEFPHVRHTPDWAYHNDDLYAWLRKQSKSHRVKSSPVTSNNSVVGQWRLRQPTVGESTLNITEKAAKLDVEEVGNGNAKSTIASYRDGLLVIHWEVRESLHGYWVLTLNEEHTKGSGRTVFIRFDNFEPGELREIEGRKVRVVDGVTIERIHPNGS
jgi:pimeloyl-ACP methyl ester carboxylesterase